MLHVQYFEGTVSDKSPTSCERQVDDNGTGCTAPSLSNARRMGMAVLGSGILTRWSLAGWAVPFKLVTVSEQMIEMKHGQYVSTLHLGEHDCMYRYSSSSTDVPR